MRLARAGARFALVDGVRSMILVVPLSACLNSTYMQHQSALVPRATSLPTDGQPMQNTAELSLGASNLGELRRPTAGDPDTGDAVPAVQLRGSIAARAMQNLALYAIYERGLASTAIAAQTSDPKINNGDVVGYGIGWAYSIETSTPGLRIGFANEIVSWSIPWIQYTSCTMMCSVPGATNISNGTSTVPVFALAVVPSYKRGRVTVFGGITGRNHPNVVNKLTTDFPMDPEVDMGPVDLLAHVGVAIEIVAGLRASVIVNQDIVGDPVRYGPGFAALLAIPLARPRAP